MVVASGAGTMWMGRFGEVWTASELRAAPRCGWRYFNDAFVDSQIDHLAIGPAGVVVIETKWRSDPWNIDDTDDPDRTRSIATVARQARKIRGLLANRGCHLPVHPAVVLWSPPGERKDPATAKAGDVTVVTGLALRSWIDSLPTTEVGGDQATRAWKVLVEHAEKRDRYVTRRDGPPRRSAVQLYWLVASYVLTALSALLAVSAAATIGHGIGLVAAAAATVLPLIGVYWRRLRTHIAVWTGSGVLLLVAFAVVYLAHRR